MSLHNATGCFMSLHALQCRFQTASCPFCTASGRFCTALRRFCDATALLPLYLPLFIATRNSNIAVCLFPQDGVARRPASAVGP
eukprot:2503661-Prymnesium_polylepis.1